MKKIGLFGGTFDPVHCGHLIIAEFLREDLVLDEVWFIPAKIHPLKSNQRITAEEHRLTMLQLAIADNPFFRVEEIELNRPNTSYTILTINELKKKYREISPEFYFFMGMDNVNQLYRWKEPMQLVRKCTVVAFGRPGIKQNKYSEKFLAHIRFVETPLVEISSTMIRNRLRENRSVRYFLPKAVGEFIEKNNLYK